VYRLGFGEQIGGGKMSAVLVRETGRKPEAALARFAPVQAN
jgi:hypothetical protein